MKTWNAKPNEIEKRWFVVDADGKTLGRLSTLIADTIRGKTKPTYTPHVDTGDFVIVVNAEKIAVTGKKLDKKMYYRHSGFPGGIYESNYRKLQAKFPDRVFQRAVKGMLPKGPLGYAMLRKLKIYGGNDHPHAAQQPVQLDIS